MFYEHEIEEYKVKTRCKFFKKVLKCDCDDLSKRLNFFEPF